MSLVVTLWLIICAWFDWKSRSISNWLTIPILVISAIWAVLNWQQLLLFWVITAIVMVALWKKGGSSGADVKIMVALSSLWPFGFVCAATLTAIVTLIVIKTKGRGKLYPAVVPIAIGAVIGIVIEKIWLIA